jgi:DNA polymerase-3 subunit gamma/tau
MAYEVLARKWRPQQFADVVGQGHVTQTLQNAIKAKRIAHAYLFVGPRGIGKTSLARLFAKALNCHEGPTVTPCDKCDSCREIMSGSSMDVMEIDGASNTGVDQVRELRENVKYAPTRGPYKIYIIDEVHMLSTAAFNALLKTLEEPPAHVKFFFATTEAHKVLATIVSRCQRFDLRRIPAALIVERLQLIAREEGVDLDGDAALAIARGAEGGLRDAESALDQLIAFRGNKITEPDVLAVFGLVSRRTLETLADALLRGDVPTLVATVAELDEAGKDMQRLNLEMLDYFRGLLVLMCAPEAAAKMDVVTAQLETFQKQATLTTPDRLLRIAEVLSQTEDRMRYSLSKRTLVETSLIRCAKTTAVSIDELIRRLDAVRKLVGSDLPVPPAGPGSASPAAGSAPAPKRTVSESAAEGGYAAPRTPPPRAPAAPAAVPVAVPAANELEALTANWHDITEKVGRMVSLARNQLLDSRPLEVTADKVVIGFDPEFSKSMERLQSPQSLRAVQNVLSQVLKRQVGVDLKLIPPDGARVDVPADHTVEQAVKPQGPAGAKVPRSKQDWVQEPVVRRALEIFNGSIVDIRE